MHGLIWLATLILDIVAVVQVLKTREEGLRKALWIALVVLLPLVGPLLWFFLGPKA